MTEIEKKATLSLQPYFGLNPIVFDIGSNKGDWADILARNVQMILFEPNTILLHYSMIRFDTLTSVAYFNFGIGAEDKEVDFYYFTNHNNGLSSIYYNPYYDELKLPMKKGKIKIKTLDSWCAPDINIAMIKIDVEGADFDVLLGAERLLSERRIKFIQIEYSNHYALAGRTFEDVVTFVRKFGYDLFHFNGESFEKRTDQQAENFYIMDKYFTQNWNGEFIKNTKGIKIQTALEIGCFEGLTTNYICDNILLEGGRIICIDPLTDEYLPGHKDNEMFRGQYDRFIRNTEGRPVELIRKKSKDAFEQLRDLRFGLIYIDGDHTEDGVFLDGVRYWNLLLDSPRGAGGFMLFDDYGQSPETARGIDRFLATQEGNYKLLIKDYQVLIQRLW
jgi:FkbM family methyltransferase